MKIPINWLKNYIKLEHTPEEFGGIMTQLEFMQDGPITSINSQDVVDLEVRQNRPDMLSIIGTAREYAAYINKPVIYPKQIGEIETAWGKPEINLNVISKDVVKRFCTVEITDIKIKKSPDWMIESLESYGIPAINNLVDITNYVMLEYGMPLHAFDYRKLEKKKGQAVLTLRQANSKEQFTTWQGTKLELTPKDLVVADSSKPVAIAGIIGGANSDINGKTSRIILEVAVYNHASIRRTSKWHLLRTEASTRHEKFLNPEMVETAVKRALFLIQDLCSGKITKIEDFYENKQDPIMIDFDVNEIPRLSGIQLEPELVVNLFKRLNFEVLEQKEALGVNKNIFTVRVPAFRTDVKIEADLVEDVLRLRGYQNIPLDPLSSAPPDYSTSASIQLEEKLRDILVKLGLNEHITNPLVKYTKDNLHIKLENPMNEDMDSLRIAIKETLKQAVEQNIKYGNDKTAVFEAGKIYTTSKGRYEEEKRVETVYRNWDMLSRIKPDLESV